MSANSYVLFSRVAAPSLQASRNDSTITSYTNENFRMRWSELRSTMWVDIKIQTLNRNSNKQRSINSKELVDGKSST